MFSASESVGGQQVAEEWAVGQLTGRNAEIGIRRVLGSSNVGIASVDVDRLRSDQHHRVQMRRQCIKSVAQC
jgi:hypothetical protein